MVSLVDKYIGSKLRHYRMSSGCAFEELCANLGLETAEWSEYENGAKRIPSDLLFEISKELDQPLSAFFAEIESGNTNGEHIADLRLKAHKLIDLIDRPESISFVVSLLRSLR